ncbi:PQQ-binding-like beta-propeller repeat protein [Actinomadura sp. J1-007]|nr:PQQ-binding-like beta-propeller repeat protein [Actinomadura sp. J1-007]
MPGLFLPESDAPPAAGDEWLPGPVAAEVAAGADAADGTGAGTGRGHPFGRRKALAGLAAGGVTAALAGTAVWTAGGADLLASVMRKPAPRELWRKQVPHGSIAILGEMLVHDAGEALSAVDLRTGSRRWERRVFPEPDDPAAPEPSDGGPEPLFAAAGDALYAAGGPDDSLRRLDPATGSVVASVDDLVAATAVLGAQDSVIFCGDAASTTLTAVDGARLTALWTIDRQPEDVIIVPPSGGLVFRARSSGRVHAYAVADGTQRWQADTDAGAMQALVLDRGTVYAAGRHLFALDAATGRKRWVSTGPSGSAGGSVVVRDGDVLTDTPGSARSTGAPAPRGGGGTPRGSDPWRSAGSCCSPRGSAPHRATGTRASSAGT